MANPYHAGFSGYDDGGRDPYGPQAKGTAARKSQSSSKGFSGMNNSQYSNTKQKPRNQDDALRMLNEMMGKRVHEFERAYDRK